MTFSRQAPPGAGRLSGVEAGKTKHNSNKESRLEDSQTARNKPTKLDEMF
jgi:hypothetical protein